MTDTLNLYYARIANMGDLLNPLIIERCFGYRVERCSFLTGDLCAIDTRRLELVGADLDPKSLLGTVGWKGPVDYTVVNGKVTVRSGKLVNLDEEKAAREAAALVRDYLSR